MGTEEFDKIKWRKGADVLYKKDRFCVSSVDYDEKLLELSNALKITVTKGVIQDQEPNFWVRCENVEIVK